MSAAFELCSRAVEELAAHNPDLAVELGVASEPGAWGDYSPAGVAGQRAIAARLLDEARALTTADDDERVALRVLADEMEAELRFIDSGGPGRDLNSIACAWQGLRDVFELLPTDTTAEWEAIIRRLDTMATPLDGYIDTLITGEPVARRQLVEAIRQGRAAQGPASSLRNLAEAHATALPDETDQQRRLTVAIDTACAAYGAATDRIEAELLPAGREADAVGTEQYLAAARRWLGTTIDLDDTYAWGWSEVERLWSRLEQACARVDADATVGEVMALLANEPDRAAPDQRAFLDVMLERQLQALEQLDGDAFDVPEPIRRIEVKAAPPGGALAPYYTGPSEDFERPGRVWYPMEGRDTFPLYDEVSTAYHEGFPGHHLQVGWQAAMGDRVSRFHRMWVWYPGSGEGWALYAEHLMGELGYHEKVDYEIGMLAAQLMRACRVVIDIGLHTERTIPDDAMFAPGQAWTFELAEQMLREVAFNAPAMATSEVVRYLGWPGQAITYKLGEKAILDLRAEWERNGRGDLKAFHARVLDAGAVGLDLLAELVRT